MVDPEKYTEDVTEPNEDVKVHSSYETDSFVYKSSKEVDVVDIEIKWSCIDQARGSGVEIRQHASVISRLFKDHNFRLRILHSLCIWWTLMAMGWQSGLLGPTFPDIRLIIDKDLETASWLFTARSLGSLIGAGVGGFMYGRYNNLKMFVLLNLVFASLTAIVPWSGSFYVMLAIFVVQGIVFGTLDTSITADIMAVFRSQAGPFLQFVHFGFSLGNIISPMTSEPFLTHIDPNAEVNTFYPYNSTMAQNTFNSSSTHFYGYTIPSPVKKEDTINEIIPLHVETNIHYAYLMSSVVSVMAALAFILVYCIMGNVYKIPLSTDRRKQAIKTRTRILSNQTKTLFLIITTFLMVLYVASERHISSFLMTFAISGIGWTKTKGASLTSAFWSAHTIGRLIGVSIFKIIKVSHIVMVYIMLFSIGAVGTWLAVRFRIDMLVWISVVVLGFGMSVLCAALFGWIATHITIVTGKIAAMITVSYGVGSMLLPIITGYLMKNYTYMWFIYLQLIICSSMFVVYLFELLLYKNLIK